MSRRFVVLALAAAAGVTASTALAKPPSPQPDPELLQLNTLCAQLPHPTDTCSATGVFCPQSVRVRIACKTVATTGPANADVQKLQLRLPLTYAKVALSCRSDAAVRVACRISSRTITTAEPLGVRVAVLRLPAGFTAVRIACGAAKAKFGCKLQK